MSFYENIEQLLHLNEICINNVEHCEVRALKYQNEIFYKEKSFYLIYIYDMIYLLNAIGLTPGGSSTVHIYAQRVHRTTQITTNLEE
jgi:hypothetical protein